jgi:ubiquitin C-terminal hydrolase
MPLAFIIALEDGVALYVEGRLVKIPKGSCFIFKGDLAHQGLEGAMGARLHGYIGTRFHPASIDYNGFIYGPAYYAKKLLVPLIQRHLDSKVHFGLPNNLTNCYLNVIIQVLRVLEPLIDLLRDLQKYVRKETLINDCLYIIDVGRRKINVRVYQRLIMNITSSPSMQDVDEIFRKIIERFGSISNSLYQRARVVDEYHYLFELNVRSYLACPVCQNLTIKSQTHQSVIINLGVSKKVSGLSDLLTRSSIFGNHPVEEWNCSCPRDNGKIIAQSWSRICSLPRILLVVFARFKKGLEKKIRTPVSFEERINLRSFLDDDKNSLVQTLYWLTSIIIHTGASRQSGHYICYVRATETSDWIFYNDTERRSCGEHGLSKESEVKNAYILLYQQKQLSKEDLSQM